MAEEEGSEGAGAQDGKNKGAGAAAAAGLAGGPGAWIFELAKRLPVIWWALGVAAIAEIAAYANKRLGGGPKGLLVAAVVVLVLIVLLKVVADVVRMPADPTLGKIVVAFVVVLLLLCLAIGLLVAFHRELRETIDDLSGRSAPPPLPTAPASLASTAAVLQVPPSATLTAVVPPDRMEPTVKPATMTAPKETDGTVGQCTGMRTQVSNAVHALNHAPARLELTIGTDPRKEFLFGGPWDTAMKGSAALVDKQRRFPNCPPARLTITWP
ncbi:MAG TPA: hypothetical protein VHE30_21280 [Polyangiaceae bacterium]|nr:hypothetical protein [Polyangiaceae bacterium]